MTRLEGFKLTNGIDEETGYTEGDSNDSESSFN